MVKIYQDSLAHHGILGMKWGVRRYQNEDGSYTDLGKKRHADDASNPDTYRASSQKEINNIWKYSKHKDITMPSGTEFYRFGDKDEHFGQAKREDLYATPSIKDRKTYSGSVGLQADRRHCYTYASNKDVKIASRDTVARTLLEMCNNDAGAAKTQQSILDGKRLLQSSKKLTKAMNTSVSDFDNMSRWRQRRVVDTLIRNTTGKASFGTTENHRGLRLNIEK